MRFIFNGRIEKEKWNERTSFQAAAFGLRMYITAMVTTTSTMMTMFNQGAS